MKSFFSAACKIITTCCWPCNGPPKKRYLATLRRRWNDGLFVVVQLFRLGVLAPAEAGKRSPVKGHSWVCDTQSWRVSKKGGFTPQIPPVIIDLHMGFSFTNHPAIGSPHFHEGSVSLLQLPGRIWAGSRSVLLSSTPGSRNASTRMEGVMNIHEILCAVPQNGTFHREHYDKP